MNKTPLAIFASWAVLLAVGAFPALVSKIGDERGRAMCGFAACYAGWLRLPGTRPQHPTSSSPHLRLSLRRGEDERIGAILARKGVALPPSGAAEPQRSANLDSSAFPARAAVPDPSPALDLPGYNAEIARWSAAANRLREHPGEASALRRQLPDHWSVVVQQQRFLVSTRWLGAALDRVVAKPEQASEASREISARLKTMLQDSQDLSAPGEPGPRQPRVKLDEILKRREYRSLRAVSEEPSFWDRISDWFWNFLDKIFSRAGNHPTVNRVLLWSVVATLGLIFLGWLICSLAGISFSNLSLRRVQTPYQPSAPVGSWQEWLQKARVAASRGDYREAIRIIYGAAVRRIELTGAWQVDPARTHREYLRLLPSGSLHRPGLVAITNCFERVWYGHAEASAADYEAMLTELEALR